jgi:hypothetical protein
LLPDACLVAFNGEGLFKQDGVTIDGEKVADPNLHNVGGRDFVCRPASVVLPGSG